MVEDAHAAACTDTPIHQAMVRAAAWRALPACLDLLPPELRRARALPLLLRQCRDTDSHAEVQRALAAGFGALLPRLVADMEGDADVAACLGCYRGLAWRHDHATRLACAAAFPAVLRAGTARRYASHLHDALTRLAGDAAPEVRLAMAAALPDVAAALGRERCCQYLRQPTAALLQDERPEVAAALLGRLPELLSHFNPTGATAASAAAAEEQRAKVFAPFVEPLLRAEAGSGAAWRLQLAWLQAAAALPAYLPPEPLHDRFLPVALKYMGEGAAAVRDAAAAAVAALWRGLRKPGQRTALYGRLVRDFAQARAGCWGRCLWAGSASAPVHVLPGLPSAACAARPPPPGPCPPVCTASPHLSCLDAPPAPQGRSYRCRLAFLDLVRHAQQRFSCKFVKAGSRRGAADDGPVPASPALPTCAANARCPATLRRHPTPPAHRHCLPLLPRRRTCWSRRWRCATTACPTCGRTWRGPCRA